MDQSFIQGSHKLGKGDNPNNWAYGFRLTNPNWNQNEGMLSFNGISFDGFKSLSSILNNFIILMQNQININRILMKRLLKWM